MKTYQTKIQRQREQQQRIEKIKDIALAWICAIIYIYFIFLTATLIPIE